MSEHRLRVLVGGRLPASFPSSAFEDRAEITVANTDEELRQAVHAAQVLYSWQIPDTIPEGTPDLRWVQLPSAGADHVLGTPLWKSDILLTASKGIHTVPMSEHLFAMLLALTRQVPDMVRAQSRKDWLQAGRGINDRPGELRGRTMGIVGWGKIGEGVAHLARAFGMRVVGTRWSLTVPRQTTDHTVEPFSDPPWTEAIDELPDILYPASQLHEVLSESDVVVLILPLTPDTERSFGAEEFRAMKRGAIFCNIGRGQVVDEPALVEALRNGALGGAALDVFAEEPLPRSSPLWSLPNVLVSPHLGGFSDRTRDRGARLFAVNLARFLEGQPLLNLVDRKRGY